MRHSLWPIYNPLRCIFSDVAKCSQLSSIPSEKRTINLQKKFSSVNANASSFPDVVHTRVFLCTNMSRCCNSVKRAAYVRPTICWLTAGHISGSKCWMRRGRAAVISFFSPWNCEWEAERRECRNSGINVPGKICARIFWMIRFHGIPV